MIIKRFDPQWYLEKYPDVVASGVPPDVHYDRFGKAEGRFPYPPTLIDHIAVFPLRVRNRVVRTVRRVYVSLLCVRLNAGWYLQNNPDVVASGISAEKHYKYFGWAEGRRPCPPNTLERYWMRARVILSAAKTVVGQKGVRFVFARVVRVMKSEGLAGLKKRVLKVHQSETAVNYLDWIAVNELTEADREDALLKLENLDTKPLISIVMPVYNSNLEWLEAAISSIQNQVYKNWELCIADDASPAPGLKPFLEAAAKKDSRIKIVYREKNGHISAASNSAIEVATGDWIALFDHDDLLHPYAFYWVALAIHKNPDCKLIYTDEDKIDESGQRHDPYFKPDWNYDLFLSQNMFSHLGVIKKDLLSSVGGFRVGYEGSQDHDLILRASEHVTAEQIFHIPKVLYHWRVHEESTAKSSSTKPYAVIAGEKAIQDHLKRKNIAGRVSFEGYGYRVKYSLPARLPLVSLVIPTRNGLSLLQQCITSILEKTTYKNFEVIVVDNGSDDLETLEYLEALKQKPNFMILRDDRPFNYSQLNNLAVKHANGEIIGLINNDIEVISPDWLSEMVSHSLRPGVGAVGAKLLFPDGRLQHGGVILGVGGVANHAHLFSPGNHHGYFGRMSVIQEFSAVTAACLLIKKSIFEEAGGLDEVNLTVAFNDIDFCIRVNKLGYRNIWTPYALLYHHESATRGQDVAPEKRARFVREVEYMMTTWGGDFVSDPFYNPNLNLDFPDFSLSKSHRLAKSQLRL